MNEAQTIFMDNLVTPDETGGTLHGMPIDHEMVSRNSIIPFSPAQRIASDWLRNYFEKYAEHAPDRVDSKVAKIKMN